MAAGGGVFTTYNKVLPGAYINFVSKARALGTLGERGIVMMPFICGWGNSGDIIEIYSDDFQTNALKLLGYDYTSDELFPLREVFKGATCVKLYRICGGQKAAGDIGGLHVSALYSGERGNDIKVSISKSVDDNSKFYVRTYVGDDLVLVDEQLVKEPEEISANDFVYFNFEGDSGLTSGSISLEGGTNGEPTGNDYSMFLEKAEACDFTTILYPGNDNVTKGLFTSFTKRLREDEGYKITCVLYDYVNADFEGVISVKNCSDAVYWVAGQTAGAEVNQSITNKAYDGELIIDTEYKKSELKAAIQNGEFAFYGDKDEVKVLKDINTFTDYSPNKNSDFSNNQVIRVLDAVANDTARIFDDYYLGKVQNNDIGRDMFKSELINYHNQLQAIQAIENFTAEDIEVKKGTEKGDVIVNEYIEPVGAMDKLYMTCIVE